MTFRFFFKRILLGVFCFFVLPFFSAASTQSHDLIRQGVDQLKEKNVKAALKKFRAAEKADASDAEACFFQGAALNRLGHHSEALEKLEKAKDMDSQHPDLNFEMGWSLLKVGRFEESANILEEYEKAHPGRGQTSEFLGRAYFYMGQDDKAEASLKEAVHRDPGLKLTCALFLSSIAEASGNTDLSSQSLAYIIQESPRSLISQALLNQIAWSDMKKQRPWRVSVSTSGGYNSNVIGLGDSILLPTDISSKDAAFFRFSLGGNYGWSLTPWDSLTAGYGFLADFYDELSDNNILDHYGYAQYAHAFDENQVGYFKVSDEFTELGGNKFRNKVSVRPSYSYRFNPDFVVESYYVFSHQDFYFSTADVHDRDGLSHSLGLDGYWKIPKTLFMARLGYYHLWNLADGGDFDYDSNAIGLSLSHPFLWKIIGEFSYTHFFDGYDNNNSFAGAGFEFARDDDVDLISVQMSCPINKWLKAYTRYDYTRDDSNIEFYNFDQHVATAGLIAEY